ncbi:MAG: arsenate reductase ArsC [Ignavibacteriaceae bacterium]|nr:arsenate reductase ArsC [Ignavibacteriaceae bacterium]
MKKRILILCTGNSCRSQIAEGFLKSFDNELEVYSAGTNPSKQVHPKAVQVMSEVGIDLSKNYPKKVDQFINDSFDYVITVCGNAKETCPVFIGKVGKQLHIGFEDPAEATGKEEEILSAFRKIRDEIKKEFYSFYLQAKKVKIEVQHFEGCPNSEELIARVKAAMVKFSKRIEYKEILVETQEEAERVKFRGSPTVLINRTDLENMPEPTKANLACRYYKNGLPSIDQIKKFITDQF